MSELILKPGLLWEMVKERTEQAKRSQALQSIPTEWQLVEDQGISFLVRVLSALARKEKARKQQTQQAKKGQPVNPFLPCERALFVTDISETHFCLLNKFNVVDHHLLIITKAFEPQENWLNLQDFQAILTSLQEVEGLAFYNGGKNAGASQPHKHLQLVPFPLIPLGQNLPIEPLLNKATFPHVSAFPFQHAFTRFNASLSPEMLLNTYQHLLESVGLWHPKIEEKQQTNAYNLLLTRDWMLIIPRSQEQFMSIPVNSLGFAGTFFVKNEEQLNRLTEYRPFEILKNVGYPKKTGNSV